jgi:hypothetical protein
VTEYLWKNLGDVAYSFIPEFADPERAAIFLDKAAVTVQASECAMVVKNLTVLTVSSYLLLLGVRSINSNSKTTNGQ